MSPSESAGPFAPGDAFERLGVLETLSYGVVWEGKLFRASQAEPLTFLELDRAFQRDKDGFQRLLDALATAGKLSGIGVAASHGVWRDGDSAYLVWEALTGLSLARAFEVLAATGARLSTEAVLRVTGGILSALDQAATPFPGSEDAPYAHGLLTPENVFLAEGQRVLVRGFGLWPAVTLAGLVRPTQARYLAPAELRTGTASPRSDLFSLATILFELVCGIPAFDGSPDEEGISSLKASIEERQSKAGATLLPLYGAMLDCLSPGPPVPVFRGRLKKTVDTLFLDELPRERAAKSFSIEDLFGRVKERRPAVVKARPLVLSRAAVIVGASSLAAEPAPSAVISAETDTPRAAAGGSRVAAVPGRLSPPPALGHERLRRRPFVTLLPFGVFLVLLGVLATIIVRSRRVPAQPPAEPPETATALQTPAETPIPPAAETAPVPTAPPAASPAAAARTAAAEAAAPRRHRQRAGGNGPVRRGNPRPERPSSPPGDVIAGPGASEPSAPPRSIPPGSLVSIDTPGLVRPFVSRAPETLRYGASDPRPAVTRTALLEILVDERGGVRDSRILHVESPPPGFSSGVERHLAALRFEPARVGEMPVRVWMRYELKYLAP